MDNEVSSVEEAQLRCSDLEVPLLTWSTFEHVAMTFLNDITERQWLQLAEDNIDLDTVILLSDLCYEIVQTVHEIVLDAVLPQVRGWKSKKYTTEGLNYVTVTEDDIEACLDNSLYECLGELLDVVLKRSDNSDHLRQLIAKEVAIKVNRSLMKHVVSSTEYEEYLLGETPGFHTKQMVYYMAKILHSCVLKKGPLETSDEESVDSNVTEVSQPDYVTIVEQLSINEDNEPAKPGVLFTPATKPKWMKEKSFLAVFLGKLLDHIAQTTKTSVSDMDFDRVWKDLRVKIAGDAGFIPPQSVENLHLSIFEILRQEFGSAKKLQAAVISGNPEFAEAVSRALKSQLKKAVTQKSFLNKAKKLRVGGRKKNKVVPVCDVNMSVSHCEVVHLEDNVRLTNPEQRESSNIGRIFSSISKVLRKPFDWIRGGFQCN